MGGRSVVNENITQWVEIRPEKDRFHRLLEILGEWYERGKLLIFVDKQESCDNLFRWGGVRTKSIRGTWRLLEPLKQPRVSQIILYGKISFSAL